MDGMEQPNQDLNARRKGNLQMLGDTGSWHYQTSRNERKN